MTDTEMHILTIKYNAIGTKKTDRDAYCNTNTAITQDAGGEQHYINTRQETGRPGRCYNNTQSNSSLNLNSTDKSMINNNEIEYFLQGPNHANYRRASTVIKKQL